MAAAGIAGFWPCQLTGRKRIHGIGPKSGIRPMRFPMRWIAVI